MEFSEKILRGFTVIWCFHCLVGCTLHKKLRSYSHSECPVLNVRYAVDLHYSRSAVFEPWQLLFCSGKAANVRKRLGRVERATQWPCISVTKGGKMSICLRPHTFSIILLAKRQPASRWDTPESSLRGRPMEEKENPSIQVLVLPFIYIYVIFIFLSSYNNYVVYI